MRVDLVGAAGAASASTGLAVRVRVTLGTAGFAEMNFAARPRGVADGFGCVSADLAAGVFGAGSTG
ncbi:MAG: hypothetical protein FWD80_05525 [Propionibacteriaceae bacterium]|nr:hypothetical protein [Propionibacteriaceae bacterium]